MMVIACDRCVARRCFRARSMRWLPMMRLVPESGSRIGRSYSDSIFAFGWFTFPYGIEAARLQDFGRRVTQAYETYDSMVLDACPLNNVVARDVLTRRRPFRRRAAKWFPFSNVILELGLHEAPSSRNATLDHWRASATDFVIYCKDSFELVDARK